ncbi:MAG: carboxymuconolactone decarboxylase family protein [Pseudomonadota bacterium]
MTLPIPSRDDVSAANQSIFDQLQSKLGFVPNLYATFAHSETALATYLAATGAKTSLSAREAEVVNLSVSEVNGCTYCLSAHTAIAGMNGLTPDQILEIRAGRARWDAKLDALAILAHDMAERRGHAAPAVVEAFLAAGWTEANLVDVVMAVGLKTVSNYLHSATKVPVDFPEAAPLETMVAAE